MAARNLTAKGIESAPTKQKPYVLRDASGLTVRVGTNGTKSIRFRVRAEIFRRPSTKPGKGDTTERLITIGPWSLSEAHGFVTIGQARTWADRFRVALKAGPDAFAAVERELEGTLAPLAPVSASQGPTVNQVAADWLKVIAHQRKRPHEAEYNLRKSILPLIGDRPLLSLKKSDCRAVVEAVVKRDAPVHAGKVLGLLKQLLSYAENVHDDFVSPAGALKARNLGVKSNVKERWLDRPEVVAFWRALDMTSDEIKAARFEVPTERIRIALKLLLLTAARTGELRLARWSDVDFKRRIWTIPVANQKLTLEQAKKAKPFEVPLSPTAFALFEDLRGLRDDEEEHVLPKFRERAIKGADRSTPPTFTIDDKTIGKAMRRFWLGHPALKHLLPKASPHDLRRTARTWLGKLGVLPHVAERCLNHSAGRVKKTYDQGDYLTEHRAALKTWDAAIAEWLTSNE